MINVLCKDTLSVRNKCQPFKMAMIGEDILRFPRLLRLAISWTGTFTALLGIFIEDPSITLTDMHGSS